MGLVQYGNIVTSERGPRKAKYANLAEKNTPEQSRVKFQDF